MVSLTIMTDLDTGYYDLIVFTLMAMTLFLVNHIISRMWPIESLVSTTVNLELNILSNNIDPGPSGTTVDVNTN